MQEASGLSDRLLQGIAALEQAYNHWDAGEFRAAAGIFAQAAATNPSDYLPAYWQGAAFYNLATYYLYGLEKDRNLELGRKAIDEGLRLLDLCVEKNPEFSEALALRGVMRGMKIQHDFWSVFSLGPGVESDRNRALRLDPKNPRVYYFTGLSLWFAPEIFGGGSAKALEFLLQAEVLFEHEAGLAKAPGLPAWGRSACLTFIGDVFARRGEAVRAREYYQKAQAINPQDPRAKEGIRRMHAEKK